MEYFEEIKTTIMDVVLLDVEFQDLDRVLLVTKQAGAPPSISGKVMLENLETVLGVKHNVVFAFTDCVQ